MKSCPIEIGDNIIESQISYLKSLGKKYAIITDDQVEGLHGHRLHQLLSSSGLEAHLFSFPSGENHKTSKTKETLENRLFEKGFGKDACIIGLGGGVVTDVAGFIASTYCRGLKAILIPTTLLGMVDASIGGKNGVNTPYGKNMLGTLYHPEKVLIDISFLHTLPKKGIVSASAEMIKHALIADKNYFHELENDRDAILTLQTPALAEAISRSISIKTAIIKKGTRDLLNFGHTVAHALETLTQYSISHGQAVAIGMLTEAFIACERGLLSKNSWAKIKAILNDYQILEALPKFVLKDLENIMSRDKKSLDGIPRFIMIEEIGKAPQDFCIPVKTIELQKALQWMTHAFCCH